MANAASTELKRSSAESSRSPAEIKTRQRAYVFDFLRIFACFMVIVNHTNSAIFREFFPSVSGHASLILFFISKTAVPVFFMISGALLLGKKDTYKTAYSKRAFRIAADIIVFSVLTAFVFNGGFSFLNLSFFSSMINKPYITPYWYLYSYFAIMLMLPFLQRLVNALSKKDLTVLLSLLFFVHTIVSFISYLEIIPSASNYFTREFFSGDIFYFFFGYYIYKFLPDMLNTAKRKRIVLSISPAAFFAGIIFSWYRTSQEFYADGEFSLRLDNIYGLPVLLSSVGLFVFVFLLLKDVKITGRLSKLITIVSSSTFGIYLTHYIIIRKGNSVMELLKDSMNDFIAVLIFDVIVFIVGAVGITILRLIPKVKNFL